MIQNCFVDVNLNKHCRGDSSLDSAKALHKTYWCLYLYAYVCARSTAESTAPGCCCQRDKGKIRELQIATCCLSRLLPAIPPPALATDLEGISPHLCLPNTLALAPSHIRQCR